MIDFKYEDNCETKQLDIWDKSDEFNYQKAVIVIDELGLRTEINSSTNPRLIDFLNPNLNTKISIDVSYDGLYKIDYYLFQSREAVLYDIGSNIVSAPNIYDSFLGFDYIYLDTIYEIDKTMSNTNTLFLKEPVQGNSILVYKGKKHQKDVAYLYNTKKELTKRVLNLRCQNCSNEEAVFNKSFLYIDLLKQDVNASYDEKKNIVDELLNRYGTIRC